MRVALFTDTLADLNGVARFIGAAARDALVRAPIHPDRELLVLTSTPRELEATPNTVNVAPRAWRAMPHYPELAVVWPPFRALSAAVDRFHPDAVHVSTPGPVGFVGRAAALRLGVPLLGTYHTDFPRYVDTLADDPVISWSFRQMQRWFYRPFSTILTRSAAYARQLADEGVPCSRLRALRPGIDTARFSASLRDPRVWSSLGGEVFGVPCPRDAHATTDPLRVLYVGRVSREKNLQRLVDAWPMVERNATDTSSRPLQLVVVGEGPFRADMQRQLASSIERGTALFLGARRAPLLQTLFASANLFVFPSTTDTLGQVVIEAQCSGLPAIVTDAGGPREIVRDGVSGLVLPADASPALWAHALVSLAQDPERCRSMSRAAAARASALTIEASLDHFWDLHRRALAPRKPCQRA
jgi:glycosyltransferase involved in cell wall biosynthesis